MQSPSKQEQPQRDLIGEVIADHLEIKSLFASVENSQGNARKAACQLLFRKLKMHESAEQKLVHPLVRQAPQGEVEANLLLKQEDKAKTLIAELEKLDFDSEEFDTKIAHFKLDVLAHADHEEQHEHPKIRATCDAKQLLKLAASFQEVEALTQ